MFIGKRAARREEAAKEAAGAAEEARYKKAQRRIDWAWGGFFAAIAIALILVGIFGPRPAAPPTWEEVMKRQTGIVNGQASEIIVADQLTTKVEEKQSFFLFAGGSTTQETDTLRIGYIYEDGTAEIITIKVADDITFNPGPGEPSAVFNFSNWREDLSLQDNVDRYLEDITVNLTLEEFVELIAS